MSSEARPRRSAAAEADRRREASERAARRRSTALLDADDDWLEPSRAVSRTIVLGEETDSHTIVLDDVRHSRTTSGEDGPISYELTLGEPEPVVETVAWPEPSGEAPPPPSLQIDREAAVASAAALADRAVSIVARPVRNLADRVGRDDHLDRPAPRSAALARREEHHVRPDRIALWAVVLGLVLVIIAATTSSADAATHAGVLLAR